MNKTGKTLLTGLLIVVVLAAAYILYGKYSAKESAVTTETTAAAATADTGAAGKTGATTGTSAATAGTTAAPAANAAPDFTVYDTDGNAVTLSSFQGKPTVVNFWASWCGYCKQEMPDFQAAYEKYGDQVNFVMVDTNGGGGDSISDAQSVISKNGFTFPVYFDTDNSGASAYGVRGIPASYFIAADGSLVSSNRGAMSGDALTAAIEALLK